MLKIQHAIPALAHSLKALHKNMPQATGKNMTPDNVRVRGEALNDAMEEIGAAFSEKMERKQKARERRNALRSQQRGKQAINKVGELNQLFELLDGGNDKQVPGELYQLFELLDDGNEKQALEYMEWLRNALRQTPPPDNDTLLEHTGGDPTRTALLLRMLGQQAQESGDTELAARSGAKLEQLKQTHGKIIRAGNNTAAAIASYTTNPQRKQSLRNLYYDSVVHQQSAVMMLDMLLELIGSRHLLPTLRTLQRALADDIAALSPSLSVVALARIHRSLRDAARISQTLFDSGQFLHRMQSKLPVVAMDPLTLARRLLQISHNGAYQSDYTSLAKEIVGTEQEHMPLFYSSLFPLVQGLPPSLWPEPANRNDAMDILRGMITSIAKTEQQQQRRDRNAQA